jgi:thiol:disulfide interchange protein
MRCMRAILTLAACLVFLPATAIYAQGDATVMVSVKPSRPVVVPGDELAVAVIFEHAPGWHIHTNKPVVPPEMAGFEPIPTTIEVTPDPGATALPIQWPPVHMTPVNFTGAPVMYGVFEGRAIAFVPIRVPRDASPGHALRITVKAQWQACNESVCVAPDTFTGVVSLRVVTAEEAAALAHDAPDPDFAGFNSAVFANEAQPTPATEPPRARPPASAVPIDFLGYRFTVQPWMIWPIAFIAGLILNLTPCVLPVIPLKVLSIQQHAREPAKLALFGTIYCLGIVSFFAVLAVLIGLFGQAWGQLNGAWWFSVPMALIVAAMGLAMMGLFVIRLPQAVYMVNPSGDTVGGNFMLGVLTAILSTPCTGPMLASVLVWAATQTAIIGVMAVVMMGVGMAFPYAVLIFFPQLVDRVPRSGPGGELLKQVLGLLMLAVAVYILSFLTADAWTWWFVGLFSAAAFVWMYVSGLRVLKGTNAKIVVTHAAILGLIVTAVMTRAMTASEAPPGVATAGEGEIPWRRFREPADGGIAAAVDDALAKGKVVVVDFTAKWCANCHVIEKTILNSAEGRAALTDPGVVPIKVDLTSSSYDEGWRILKDMSGAASIPFLAVMGRERGRDRPITYASFFKPSDLSAAIAVAAGRGTIVEGGTAPGTFGIR